MSVYHNPILYADYSDPDVVRVGEDYYMVASSFTYLPGVPLLHSKDLVHWEIINYCVPRLPFAKYQKPSHGSGTWAPSIRYHNGCFVVFIPLPDEGILVSRSEDPRGEFRLNLLCESKGWIDPCPIWDGDKAYMVFAYARSRCGIKHRLSVVEIDPDCTRLLGEPVQIFDGKQVAPTTEGPKFYKKDDWFYILMPSGGVKPGWQSCLRSHSIYGPYEYRIVMHQGTTDITGPHQGGYVESPDGHGWFIHFRDIGALGRVTWLEPVCFQNGWPFIGSDLDGDGIGEPVLNWDYPEEGKPRYEIATSDDFQAPELGLQWQWQANPDSKWYSLGERGLTLYCLSNPDRENLIYYSGSVLTQIPQSPSFSVSVKLHLDADQEGDYAGCGILGTLYSSVGVLYTGGEFRAVQIEGEAVEKEFEGNAVEKVTASSVLCSSDLTVRITLRRDLTYYYEISEDGQHFTGFGQQGKAVPAVWTGAKIFLWSGNRENTESKGYGQYRSVEITGERRN